MSNIETEIQHDPSDCKRFPNESANLIEKQALHIKAQARQIVAQSNHIERALALSEHFERCLSSERKRQLCAKARWFVGGVLACGIIALLIWGLA